MLLYTQAAYNNTAEFELEDDDVQSTVESTLSQFPIGTKVAKQFEGDDQQLVWFEGTIQRFDEDDHLYWVLYTDGDSEDMDAAEVREAAHNYRVHLQEDDVTVGVTTSSAPSITRVDVDMTDTSRSIADNAASVGDTRAGSTSQLPISSSSELRAAMQAMTAAAERLTSAATYIEAAIQQQQDARPQQTQQIMSVLPNWHMHYYWQHVMLRQQWQQRLVYYQQQQHLSFWQQRQQQMRSFR
jgi:hypothetical protein